MVSGFSPFLGRLAVFLTSNLGFFKCLKRWNHSHRWLMLVTRSLRRPLAPSYWWRRARRRRPCAGYGRFAARRPPQASGCVALRSSCKVDSETPGQCPCVRPLTPRTGGRGGAGRTRTRQVSLFDTISGTWPLAEPAFIFAFHTESGSLPMHEFVRDSMNFAC